MVDWEALRRRAFEFARLRSADDDAAHDIAQDALTALFINSSHVRNPIPWLFVVTRRLCNRQYRLHLRHIRCEQYVSTNRSAVGVTVPAIDLLGAVLRFRDLSVKQRRLLMYSALGYTDAEISWLLSCPRGSVGPLMARAMRRLERLLNAHR